MIERTLIIVGPGGIGKSPLDALFKSDVCRIDPYRLRSSGPRDADDILYAHPKLRAELLLVLDTLGDQVRQIGSPQQPVEWFPGSKALFLRVRNDWQLVILNELKGRLAKMEIHAPILPLLLSAPDINDLLGKTEIIILNPALESATVMQDWEYVEEKTRQNCTERGDMVKSIEERVNSIVKEAPVWKQLVQEYAATEYYAWEFPEYVYKRPPPGVSLMQHQKQTLIQARNRLLQGHPDLHPFFKDEDALEIHLCS